MWPPTYYSLATHSLQKRKEQKIWVRKKSYEFICFGVQRAIIGPLGMSISHLKAWAYHTLTTIRTKKPKSRVLCRPRSKYLVSRWNSKNGGKGVWRCLCFPEACAGVSCWERGRLWDHSHWSLQGRAQTPWISQIAGHLLLLIQSFVIVSAHHLFGNHIYHLYIWRLILICIAFVFKCSPLEQFLSFKMGIILYMVC